jgi:hypothetical protein
VEPLTPSLTQATGPQSASAMSTFRPKSLNLFSRKRDIQMIEQENFKFAKRLFESQGEISLKDQKMDFRHHQKLVENMQKLKKKG